MWTRSGALVNKGCDVLLEKPPKVEGVSGQGDVRIWNPLTFIHPKMGPHGGLDRMFWLKGNLLKLERPTSGSDSHCCVGRVDREIEQVYH